MIDRAVTNPLETLDPSWVKLERRAGVIGIAGLLTCCAGLFFNREALFQSYLFAFIYWSGFALGGLGVLLLHHTVGGRWGATTRRILEALTRTLPLIFVLFLPLLAGLYYLYPWARPEEVIHNEVLRHKQGYLNLPFFLVRLVVYFAAWCFWAFRVNRLSDEQDRTGDPSLPNKMRAFSAPGLLVFVLTTTFAYIDWILSANAEFYSTVYGAMILVGDVLQTFALTLIVLITASSKDRFGGRIHSAVLHDLGNLMFAFVIFWAYLSASQLIIVWPANLPQELGWYLDRVSGLWRIVAIAVAFCMFVLPFLALLSQDTKRNPRKLIWVAVFILGARMIDVFWIVEPTYRKAFHFTWTDVAALVGVGGLWIYVFLGQLRRRPLLPLRDLRVSQPITEAAV